MITPSLTELALLWNELGPNGKRVLYALAERLVVGHRRYGDFPIRKWTREATEESLDKCVYLTADLLFADDEAAKGH